MAIMGVLIKREESQIFMEEEQVMKEVLKEVFFMEKVHFQTDIAVFLK